MLIALKSGTFLTDNMYFQGFRIRSLFKQFTRNLAAVLFLSPFTLFCGAQGSSASTTDGSAGPDCTDPITAMSSACTAVSSPQQRDGSLVPSYGGSGQQSTTTHGGLNNQSYSDDGGMGAGNRSVRQMQAPEAPEPLSEFQKFVSATTGQVLPIFGAGLFQNMPATFAPMDQGPVTADYLLGPGDELRIRVWGQVNFTASLHIDRSGNVYLPQIGQVHVAGLPYSSVQEHLRGEVARVFRNFDLTVDLGQLRSIQVFIVGQVRRPGSYTISSLSTLINALFASGGPSPQGSLRHIQLKRGSQIVTYFDLYDLLLRGDKSKDVPLLPGDVIFVPTVGAQVALTGSVRHPSIYELGDDNTLAQLLSDAGGTSALASTARISIERLQANAGRIAMEIGLDETGLKTALRDGDLLRVLSVVPAYDKTVTLRGNTANPGRFAWHQGMRLSELIPDRSALITRDYWWQRTRLGLPGPEFQPDATGPVQVQPRYPVNLESFPCAVRAVNGEDQPEYASPGQATDAPCTPYDRYNPNQLPQQYRYPEAAISDQLTSQTSTLRSQGAGANGGSLAASQDQQDQENQRNQTARVGRTDVRLSAPEIDWNYAVIERMDQQTLKTSLLPFNLGRLVMGHDASQDLELQSGDVVSIFSQADIRVPTAEQTKLVHLEGEFVGAGIYSVQPGETLRQLIKRAGGITPAAYLYGSEFTRESTRVLQQARIHEYVRSLELQITRGSIEQATASTSSPQDLQEANAAAVGERDVISQLNQIHATGRIVFDIDPDASSVEVLPELPLEDGDRFVLPSRPATVNVIGAVYDQNSFLFQPGSRVRDYLHQSGGANRDADRRRAFIIRADGSVISRQSRSAGDFNTTRMHPGDSIVIPEKIFRPSSLRAFIAYTQIFSQLALGAAAIDIIH